MAGEFQLPQGWTTTPIDGLGRVLTGKTPSTQVAAHFGGRIPFITPSDMDGRRVIAHTARYLTEQGAASVSSARIPKGAVMISCIGSDMGKAAIAGYDAVTNQQINSIVVRTGISSLYVYYNLSMRKSEIQHLGVGGSAVPILNKGHFSQLQVALPPFKEQQAIAHILGTLDDKIELNRRMNATLEAMARALFKSWFVDFAPVRAKVEGRDTGLPAEIAGLFPDGFEESAVGEVPRGWRVEPVASVCQAISSGGTPSTRVPDYWGGDIPWLSSGETRDKFIIETEKKITPAGVSNSSTRLAPATSTVIAGAGQGHTRGQTSLLMIDSYINQSVVVLVADTEMSSAYHLFLDLERRYEEFRRISDAHSSRGSLTTKLLGGLHIVVPHRDIISEFDRSVEPMIARIVANLRQSRTLAALRDALLPKLISGEVRVGDAARFMGAAA